MKPWRSSKYRSFIASLPCLICGHKAEAAHIGPHALSQKAPDDRCVPLCSKHHAELHGTGGRRAFELKYDCNLLAIADRLSIKPFIHISPYGSGSCFIGRIEGEEIPLAYVDSLESLKVAVKLICNYRREQLRNEPVIQRRRIA